jgi:hypothetical protein
MKRGQLSIFILLGAVIVIAVALLLYMRQAPLSQPLAPPEFREAQQALEACAGKVLSDGVIFVSLRGGMYNIHQAYIMTNLTRVPFWYYGGSAVPSLDVVNHQIALYMDNNIQECVDTFAIPGVSIKASSFSTQAGEVMGQMTAVTTTDLVLTKGSATYRPGQLSGKSMLPFGDAYDAAQRITQAFAVNPSVIPVSAINAIEPHTLITSADNRNLLVMVEKQGRTGENVQLFFGVRLAPSASAVPAVGRGVRP